jgi:Putative antitoxin
MGSNTNFFPLDGLTQAMHGLCMATISIEIDAYELLKREKRSERESFSQVVRRLASERPALTAGELEEAMKPFIGKGAGKKR